MTSLLPSCVSHLGVLRRERPDLVWINTITNPLWIVIARLSGHHVICHSHEIVGGPRLLRMILYLPLFLASRVVVVSEACRADIRRTFRSLDRRVSVAINPSFSIREPVPVRNGSENHFVVLGRISARKGHRVLVEALADSRLAVLRPVVHICGAPYRSAEAQAFASSVRERANELGADVRFHGFVPTAGALALGGIVLVPSVEPEACPLVIAEAMAAGRAVVASDCGGIREITGEAGLLVPAGRPDALATSLAQILADESERRRLEEASLERAESLSAHDYLARIDKLIEDAMGRQAEDVARPRRSPGRAET